MKRQSPQDLRDAMLENEIALAGLIFQSSGKQEHLDNLNRLVAQRSPSQIERLRRAKAGL